MSEKLGPTGAIILAERIEVIGGGDQNGPLTRATNPNAYDALRTVCEAIASLTPRVKPMDLTTKKTNPNNQKPEPTLVYVAPKSNKIA